MYRYAQLHVRRRRRLNDDEGKEERQDGTRQPWLGRVVRSPASLSQSDSGPPDIDPRRLRTSPRTTMITAITRSPPHSLFHSPSYPLTQE